MEKMMNKPVVLCILDGVGVSEQKEHNAVALAKMPYFNKLIKKYPNSLLRASGTAVGLPGNLMGNSEVGHICIGAGRVVMQYLLRFSREDWNKNKPLNKFISDVKRDGGIVHFAGLMSDGRVHSDVRDEMVIVKHILDAGLRVCMHFIGDGRDTPPRSALKYVRLIKRTLAKYFADGRVFFGTLSGRYYTMDRNKNMDRTELAFNALARAKSEYSADNIEDAIKQNYANDITDEFFKPTLINAVPITKKDGFIFGNYRSDRARQIVRAMLDTGCHMLCFSQYGEGLNEKCPAILEDISVNNTLGDVVAKSGLTQLRIAETEKYNHVTYFMDAERTIDFNGEEKVLIDSPAVATFDMKPEMSAYEITDALIPRLSKFDVVIMNFANGDMVGHTGNEKATIKAMQVLDEQLSKIVPEVLKLGGQMLIIADHGNAEKMWDDKSNSPWTAHTNNKVRAIMVSEPMVKKIKNGGLADVAPTILKLLGIKQPKDMTGKALI
ncbi:MAG: 2,3-bisphosphoglycerate-independent phosphoglycerate mutase [Alphaproteobacteria bacterium]|nr:2,3-bisphosphoglycerate-independent phosphoglycerate mutase [Alphaproteobacteria bacterium]